MTTRPVSARRLRDLAQLRRVRDRIDRRQQANATAGMPPCVAKGVTRPVRNREAPYRAVRDPAGNMVRIQELR